MINKVTKSGVIDAYAERRDRTVREATEDLNAFLDIVTDLLADGYTVTLTGFGTFTPRLIQGAKRTPNGPLNTPRRPSYKAKFKQGSQLGRVVGAIPVDDGQVAA